MKRDFWYTVFVSCIPVILGCLITIFIAKDNALTETKTACAVLEQKVDGDKELFLNLLTEAEKRRAEQYQYLVNETNEIKESLKQKKNIASIDNALSISPDVEYLVKRGMIEKWADSLHFYVVKNDSLYLELCLNLQKISDCIN